MRMTGADNVYGGGLIAGIGFVSGRARDGRGQQFGDQGRRGASDGGREGDPRPGDRARREAALRPAGGKRRRQSDAAGGNVRARRRDLRQHGSPVGGRDSGRLDRARLFDRRRRLSDGPRRLCRHGARDARRSFSPGLLCSGPRPARSPATRTSAERSCIARRRASANISPRTTRTRCGSAGKSSPASAGEARRPARARPRLLYDPEELLGIVPVDYRKPYDVREVIARLVDGSEVSRLQAVLRTRDRLRPRGDRRARGRPHRQQRPDQLGRLEQGRPVHPALLPGGAADRLPAEHHRLPRRGRGGDLGHRQARLENDPGRHQRQRRPS